MSIILWFWVESGVQQKGKILLTALVKLSINCVASVTSVNITQTYTVVLIK